MLASMGSRELTYWMAFALDEPIGEERADLRAGLIASAAANSSAWYPKDPYRPIDFMPLQAARRQAEKPVLMDDPEAQSQLIMDLLRSKQGKHRVH